MNGEFEAAMRYLVPADGVVIVPGRVAALLNRAALNRLRRDHPELDAEARAVLMAFAAAEQVQVRRQQRAEPSAQIRPVHVSAKTAGDLLGITSRAVRMACARGSLKGELVSGSWIISRDAVDKYRSRRHSGGGRSA